MEIRFVPADPAHAAFLLEHRHDPVNQRFNPLLPSTLEELQARLSKSSSDWREFEKAESFFWFLEIGSRLAGIASVHNLDRRMLVAEIGYGISPELRGRGFATKAVLSLTKQAFVHSPLRKLTAFVHEENLASRKVLEKSGYRQEGLLREHFLVNGAPANEILYGILRREVESLPLLT